MFNYKNGFFSIETDVGFGYVLSSDTGCDADVSRGV